MSSQLVQQLAQNGTQLAQTRLAPVAPAYSNWRTGALVQIKHQWRRLVQPVTTGKWAGRDGLRNV